MDHTTFMEIKIEGNNEEQLIYLSPSDDEGLEELNTTCRLCPEASRLKNLLIEHLKEHKIEWIDINDSQTFPEIESCNCQDGIKIQINFINHFLSHDNDAQCHFESPSESDEKDIIDHGFEENYRDKEENSYKKVKLKPSYHNQYNRRVRSPVTFQLQKEFTQDPTTKMFHCNFCRNGYKHKQTVERHLSKEHYPSSEKVSNSVMRNTSENVFPTEQRNKLFYCNICHNSYKHKQTIQRHLAKEHNLELDNNYKSQVSDFKPYQKIVRIQRKSRRSKDKKLICDICGQTFFFRESLRKHLLKHVDHVTYTKKIVKTTREKIVCDQCTKLVNPSLMRRHFQVHHSDYRPYKCEEPGCTTTFLDITKFNDHKNIHLKIKPYICDFCQESFHYASNLRQHKLRHTHPDRFKCETCQSCFVSSKSLSLHMRLHNYDPTAPKPFACDHEGCDKTFRYRDRLKLHIFNVHRVENDHYCSYCSFITHKKKYLKRHMIKIHNIREGNPRNQIQTFNGLTKSIMKNELSQFYGIFFAVLSSVCYSLCSVIVKFLVGVSPIELSLFRFLGVLLPSIPYVVYKNENIFPEDNRKMLALRGMLGSAGLMLSFYAFQNMQLGDSSVIIFSTPVFVAIFSRIFLKETCGPFNIFTIILTSLGIVFIVKPPIIFGEDEGSENERTDYFWGPLAALASAIFTANAMIIIRMLRGLHHSVVICNFGVFACFFTLIMLIITNTFCLPPCENRFLILMLGIFSFWGQLLLTISLKMEEAGVISIARSTTIVFAFIWQVIFFKQIPCFYSILGALLIVSSVGLNALKKWALLNETNISRNLTRFLK
ncbi:CLUMA_CG013560, isoform A [Clunio marinus]|uniref:CLUMA_CG013560, isoform A n=1 Tax=Clunio marinus TaxID=568069 RepID=A0A1J1IJ61_9DIPT|nr:CLUMA_CG013560, isoform A [Clunio marinus]